MMPETFANLNTLEEHLLTPVLPFMKIVTLPKGAQPGMHGPVICVPADIDTTTKLLPRRDNDLCAVRVKLKRKLQYKGHYLYQQVRPEMVRSALRFLKDNHPNFKNIAVDEHMSLSIVQEMPDGNIQFESNDIPDPDRDDHADESITSKHGKTETASCQSSKDGTGDEDGEKDDDTEYVVTTSAPLTTCLQPDDMAQHISDNYEDLVFNVAPGEGHTPISIFGKEAEAFPVLFPDGQHTFTDANRQIKVGFSMYAKARLFSANAKFAQNAQYIFLFAVSQRAERYTAVSIRVNEKGKGKNITWLCYYS